MKITIYALHLSFGGVEKYISTLANMLIEEHEVEIISTYKIEENPAFYLNPGIKVHYLIEDLKPNKEELKYALKNKQFLCFIKELNKALKILYLKKKRNIESIKDCKSDVIISTRIFHNRLIGKYGAKNIVKITGEHNHHNNNNRYIEHVIKSCKNFDYFVPISKELCEFYADKMKENNVRTKYIRFCIDDNPDFKPPKFKEKQLISVARLSPEKGMSDLLDVFEIIHKKDHDIILNIVGDGPEYSSIQNRIKDKKLESSVILHGFCDKKYIYDLLARMNIYVMTSYTESFGLVLLEAMSCGIPCLAYSSAQGAHEIIEDDVNGYLIENRDRQLMATYIMKLLNDKAKINTLSEGAINTAEKFSYHNTKNEWLNFMKNIETGRRK